MNSSSRKSTRTSLAPLELARRCTSSSNFSTCSVTRKSAVPVSFKSKPLDSSLTVALHSAAGTGGEDDAALTGCLAREALPH